MSGAGWFERSVSREAFACKTLATELVRELERVATESLRVGARDERHAIAAAMLAVTEAGARWVSLAADPRETLEGAARANPSNPWIAGAASRYLAILARRA